MRRRDENRENRGFMSNSYRNAGRLLSIFNGSRWNCVN